MSWEFNDREVIEVETGHARSKPFTMQENNGIDGSGAGGQSQEQQQQRGAVICRPVKGTKDRHSKVRTMRGLRDRRVRLSAPTAIRFFDVQDRLGYDQPSKAVDWLMRQARPAIDRLNAVAGTRPSSSSSSLAATSGCSTSSVIASLSAERRRYASQSASAAPVEAVPAAGRRAESRTRARERARERAKEKCTVSGGTSIIINTTSDNTIPGSHLHEYPSLSQLPAARHPSQHFPASIPPLSLTNPFTTDSSHLLRLSAAASNNAISILPGGFMPVDIQHSMPLPQSSITSFPFSDFSPRGTLQSTRAAAAADSTFSAAPLPVAHFYGVQQPSFIYDWSNFSSNQSSYEYIDASFFDESPKSRDNIPMCIHGNSTKGDQQRHHHSQRILDYAVTRNSSSTAPPHQQ